MDLKRLGSRPSRPGPPEYFSGTVMIDPIINAPDPARINALRVTFMPGARTAWHTHPLGQTLYVLSGVGRYQTWGEPIVEIRAGDSLWIPPHEKHWHGAAPNSIMCHIALQENLNDSAADWLEHVSDEDYAENLKSAFKALS